MFSPEAKGGFTIRLHQLSGCLILIAGHVLTGCDAGSESAGVTPPAAADASQAQAPGSPRTSSPATVESPASAAQPVLAADNSAGAMFTDVTDALGINFVHQTGEDGSYRIAVPMAGGAGVFDADGDGLLDIYFINAGDVLPTNKKTNTATNTFFRQQSDGTFVDATVRSGLGDNGYGIGCAAGDLDNDGDIDVYVTNWGQDVLYQNNGDGTFTNITAEAGIDNAVHSASAAFLDFDRDGLLDIYVANYVVFNPDVNCTDIKGRPEYCGPSAFPGERDKLYRNEGGMRFRDVSQSSGIATVAKQGLGVVAAFLSGDGWVDIYVANDGVDNLLWINNRDGTFTNRAHARGAAVNLNGEPEASMGIALGDVTGDGWLDIFLTHLHKESNTLYVNDGPTVGFSDRTAAANLLTNSLEWTGFGTTLFDVDHDGLLDLAIANGAVHRRTNPLTDEPEFWCDYAEPNQLLRNTGRGRFEDISSQSGSFARELEVSRALIAADFDRDGDLDLIVTNLEGKARLYRRELDTTAAGNSWLQVRAEIPALKRDAVGALVTLVTPTMRLVRPVAPSAGYLSATVAPLHFGLGSDDRVDRIEVIWPDGAQESFPGCAARQVITIQQGEGEAVAADDSARVSHEKVSP
jgi:hypothetical protein